MKVAKVSRKSVLAAQRKAFHFSTDYPFYQVRDQFQHTDHVVAFTIWRCICRECHLLVRRVSELQCEQSARFPPVTHGCPHAPHHPAAKNVFQTSRSVAGSHRPQEIFHRKQLATPTDTKSGASYSSFSHHIPEEVRALPHDISGVDISRLHTFRQVSSILPMSTAVVCPSSVHTFSPCL